MSETQDAPDAVVSDDDKQEAPSLKMSTLQKGLSGCERSSENRLGYAYSRLTLDKMDLTTLDGDIGQLKELRYVSLSRNSIEDITPLNLLPKLYALNLSANNISNFSLGSHLLELQLLQLDRNKLTQVSAINIPSLRALTVSYNSITSFSDLPSFPNLSTLDASSNMLENLGALGNAAPALRTLNLESNSLTSLAGVERLSKLEQLRVANNKLSKDSLALLALLPYLSQLTIEGNPALIEGFSQQEFLVDLCVHLPLLEIVNGRPVDHETRVAADLALKTKLTPIQVESEPVPTGNEDDGDQDDEDS